jgi:hypothetical protein
LAQDNDDIFAMLNLAKHLYLRHISEPRENSLRLVVEEAVATEPIRSEMHAVHNELPETSKIRAGARPIKSTGICRSFELQWRRYVAYLVSEELVGSCGNREDELYTGKLFRQYSKSHFLEHLSHDTGGHTAPILHYKLICLNHLIDIASYDPPDIQLIETVPGSFESNRKPN